MDVALAGFDVSVLGLPLAFRGNILSGTNLRIDTARASLILVTSHQTTYKRRRNPADRNYYVELCVFLHACIAQPSTFPSRWTVRLTSRQTLWG
jgi:hypothetical protein